MTVVASLDSQEVDNVVGVDVLVGGLRAEEARRMLPGEL